MGKYVSASPVGFQKIRKISVLTYSFHVIMSFTGLMVFLTFLSSLLKKIYLYSKLFVCSVNFNRTLLMINMSVTAIHLGN